MTILWDAEARGSWVWGQPQLHSETASKTNEWINLNNEIKSSNGVTLQCECLVFILHGQTLSCVSQLLNPFIICLFSANSSLLCFLNVLSLVALSLSLFLKFFPHSSVLAMQDVLKNLIFFFSIFLLFLRL